MKVKITNCSREIPHAFMTYNDVNIYHLGRSETKEDFFVRDGDVPKKDIIMEQIDVDKRVMSILESMYDMAQSEDWDESSAQMLIMDGSSLYLEIKNDL